MGRTEAHSPSGEQLTHLGFLALAEETLLGMEEPVSLPEFSQKLLGGVQHIAGRRSWRRRYAFDFAAG